MELHDINNVLRDQMISLGNLSPSPRARDSQVQSLSSGGDGIVSQRKDIFYYGFINFSNILISDKPKG